MKSVWEKGGLRVHMRTCWLAGLAALGAIAALSPASALAANYDIRGEWALSLSGGPQPVPVTVSIKEMESTSGTFAGSGSLGGYYSATISGVVTGNEAAITISSQTPEGPAQFIAHKVTINPANNTMSGMGAYYKAGIMVAPGELTGQRTRNYAELLQKEKEELEAKEREQREAEERAAREKVEREAREKTEREAREAREAKERPELEAREKAEREAREQAEREAREKAEREAQAASKTTTTQTTTSGSQGAVQLVSVLPTASSFTLEGSTSVTIGLTNSNGEAVSGHVTLVFNSVSTGHTAKGSHRRATKKALLLSDASYTASAQAGATVKLKLPRAIAAELKRRKRLHAVLKLTTQGAGPAEILKTLQVTLSVGTAAHRR